MNTAKKDLISYAIMAFIDLVIYFIGLFGIMRSKNRLNSNKKNHLIVDFGPIEGVCQSEMN